MDSLLVSTVICPKCHAELSVSARRCSSCGAEQLNGTPLGAHAAAASAPQPRPSLIDRPWLIVLVLLHVGLLGIPMYWKTRYSLGTRLLICAASVAYTFFALAVIAWGLWQVYRVVTV